MSDRGPLRLLVIDDDVSMAELIGLIAEDAGYSTHITTNFEAFKSNYSDDIAIVVVDLLLPDVDGIEIIRFLSAQQSQAGVILVSGFDRRVLQTAEQLAGAQHLKMIGSLSKPFAVAALTKLLTDAVPSNLKRYKLSIPPKNEDDLRRAIQEDELIAFFQPKVAMDTGELESAEVLVRWQHPIEGILGPAVFIPLAEEVGLVDAVTEVVMEKSFTQGARWQAEGLDIKLSVNISPRSLTNLELPERIVALAASHGVGPAHIVIEVTESWLSEDLVTTLDILTRLRMKGIGLSIDDFGTGYSTMEQLKQIPFSELKLDQSFVRGAAHDAESRIIVASSIDLAHKLQLGVVAEGIESREEWDLMRDLGCDQAQGFFIARPMPADAIHDWLARWHQEYAKISTSTAYRSN